MRKRKAFIFTINDYTNYGNRLQNYALFKILQQYGLEVHNAPQIFCKECYTYYSESPIKKIIKRILPYPIWKEHMESINYHENDDRYKRFLEFASLYGDSPKVVYVKRKRDILKAIEATDVNYLVSGSDQVWNPEFFKNLYINMLGFATNTNQLKIAIAPSISVETIEDWQKTDFQKYLSSFYTLSCREQEGAKLINNITGLECETLIDPTLMLDICDWDKIIKKPCFHNNGKYILTYFLGQITPEYHNIITLIGKKLHLKIIDVYDKKGKYYQCGPSEFVWLIKNCELMLTDSFHGTIFSYIYNKPIKTFKRKDELKSMNSRLINLINVLKLKDIFIDAQTPININSILHTNYDKKILEIEQRKFNDYVLKSIRPI